MKESEILEAGAQDPAARESSPGASPFANRVLPSLQRSAAGLEPFTGTFTRTKLLHLLRRTMFGVHPADLSALSGQTLTQVLDLLLAPPPDEASMPLVYATSTSETVAVGEPWITGTTNTNSGGRNASLRSWWLGLMLNQPVSIRERMTLFWHNHFVTNISAVGDARFSYRYNALLRQHALGNVKDLTRAITIDGAMLRYLNGNRNVRTAPDENYARELQELFTIGKGPQVGAGDYTNYTEEDVKAAARVLTGWRDFRNADGTVGVTTSQFTASNHDATSKTFSARYNGTVIAGSTDGLQEINALLDMIFAQPETARFLCRKLYRWFVYYVIDAWTEANVIEPLAQTLRSNQYNILPVLRQLLGSAHFLDDINIGCMIKSPVDLVAGTCRTFNLTVPSGTVGPQYTMWNYLVSQASAWAQLLGDPPDVSGWSAYYQEPEFYELWINSDTLPRRSAWTTRMMNTGYTSSGATILIDPIAFVQTFANPVDVNALVAESAQRLFALPITANQHDFLKGILLAGQADYLWGADWTTYLGDPTNTANKNVVLTRLRNMLGYMMQMPEYQLL